MRSVAPTAEVEELYRRHAGELHAYLYRRAGQAGADLLGEVFVVTLRRRQDLPAPGLRRAWLYGIARRLLMSDDRITRRRRAAEQESAVLHDPDPTSVDSADRSRAVRAALSSLREPDQELIRLTEWERLTIAEAAVVLGLRPGTARVRLHRARRALATHPALQAWAARPASRSSYG